MLLYNAEIPPFGGLQTDVTLGGCCKKTLTSYGSKWPPPGMRKHGSPLAVTFVSLPDLPARLPTPLRGDSLAADVVNEFAAPLECIFCPSRWSGSPSIAAGTSAKHVIHQIPLSGEIPTWADALMTAMRLQDYSGRGTSPDLEPYRDEGLVADFSLVLPITERDG
jgi:hypothetical protein